MVKENIFNEKSPLPFHFVSGKHQIQQPNIMPLYLSHKKIRRQDGVKSDFQGFVEEKVFLCIEIICKKTKDCGT